MSAPARPVWRIGPMAPAAGDLARHLGVLPIVAQMLINRGLSDRASATAFLRPSLNDLHDPSLLPDMDRAARRVRRAAARGERIAIYGDYDVDGVTGTAILLRCLALLGAGATYYIPDRLDEGYGLNVAAVRALADQGVRLLITVDCGINAVEEVAEAKNSGLDVIVTDHHEPSDLLPQADCLINPKLPAADYPFRELSGAGIAFKLAWAIGKGFSDGRRVSPEFKDFLLDSLSLAALGTIADVVPLKGENRAIACFGLRGLAESDAPGLRALRAAAGLDERTISARDVAFKLAPRLNAAGRLGSARRGVELLVTAQADEAAAIAAELNQENARRQRLQEAIIREARAMLAEDETARQRHAVVLAREGWHAGVLGIVAARLAAEIWRPVALLTLEGAEGHGSARSIEALNLFETLKECAGLLTSYGGHARAAGLRIRRDALEPFRAAFERAAARRLDDSDLVPSLAVEAEAPLRAVTPELVREIESLEPFGEGNPEPLLAAFDLEVAGSVRRMGADGRHLSFWVRQDGVAARAVAFGLGEMARDLERAGRCSLAFVPRLNRWRGEERLELEVRDIKVATGGTSRSAVSGDRR